METSDGPAFMELRSNEIRKQPVDSDSSSGGESSDSEDDALSWKRQKKTTLSIPKPSSQTELSLGTSRFRRNNIWGNVLQEQTLVSVASDCDVRNDETRKKERDVESYDYTLAKKYRRKDDRQQHQNRNQNRAKEEMKSLKERLGKKTIKLTQPLNVAFTEDDTEETVTNGIAKFLNEPKVELIERVVKFLGKPKAIELLHTTQEIENMGGILIMDGTRRRTPGGVYFYLLRIDEDISKTQRNKIFEEERRETNKMELEQRKRKRKKQRARKMQVDNEGPPQPSTQANDDSKSTELNMESKSMEMEPVLAPINVSNGAIPVESKAVMELDSNLTTTAADQTVEREDGELSESGSESD